MNNKTINAQELIDFITKHKSAIFNEYDCYKDHTQSKIKWNLRNEDMFNKLITVINGMAKDETEITNFNTIKNMSVEQMVNFIDWLGSCACCVYDNTQECISLPDYKCGEMCKKGIELWLTSKVVKPKTDNAKEITIPKLNFDFEEKKEIVHCIDCKYLMFSDFYGECSKAYKGIVSPDDYCGYGVNKHKESEKDNGK